MEVETMLIIITTSMAWTRSKKKLHVTDYV